jgi:DNA-binding response OmpR family regulator
LEEGQRIIKTPSKDTNMGNALLESRFVEETVQPQEIFGSEYAPEAACTTPRRPAVLLVDDDSLARTMLGRALREQGITVWTAVDGQHALELCRDHHQEIDVVLLNTRMPGLDRRHTPTAIHEIAPAMSVCFLSGRNDCCIKVKLLKTGAALVFDTPFRPVDLARVVQGLFAKEQSGCRQDLTDSGGLAASDETSDSNSSCLGDGHWLRPLPLRIAIS